MALPVTTTRSSTPSERAISGAGADCAGVMMDEYTGLLERVGVPSKKASKNVISLFMPLIRKYRHGEKTK